MQGSSLSLLPAQCHVSATISLGQGKGNWIKLEDERKLWESLAMAHLVKPQTTNQCAQEGQSFQEYIALTGFFTVALEQHTTNTLATWGEELTHWNPDAGKDWG